MTVTHELPSLTNEEIKRYSRHLIMPEVGVEGQQRLKGGSEVLANRETHATPEAIPDWPREAPVALSDS